MYHHRLLISYKDTSYFGWQDLGTSEQKPTVQASIHQILKNSANIRAVLFPPQYEPCAAEFNLNKDCKSKEYHYYFCTDPIYNNPVLNEIVAHIPSNTATEPLDIKLMQRACKLFIGEHDFYSFARRDANISSTFRTIFSCEILQAQLSTFSNKIYYLKIVGNGFLKQMVRYIAGALFALGRNQLSLSCISEAGVMSNDKPLFIRHQQKENCPLCQRY